MLYEIRQTHGYTTPGPKYFKFAMTYFLSRYNNVHFIVCSDEITWCKQNETYLQPHALNYTYSVHFSPGKSPQWDLTLLTQLNHTIISVGSFGWWGGWLAGGEVVYFNNSVRKGSDLEKGYKAEDYFWPTWTGLGDE